MLTFKNICFSGESESEFSFTSSMLENLDEDQHGENQRKVCFNPNVQFNSN